jgi:transcriptional regulator with XRE-family HTH domain
VVVAPPSNDDAASLAAFGSRVRELRVKVGISQADLAHRAGLHPTYISGIERGRRNVGLLNIIALSRALGVQPAELL